MRPPNVLIETPIRFDVADRVLHCPLVRASVNGAPTTFILDTGSTDHVMTVELAERAGLRPAPAEPGTDHAGAPVPSWILGDVPVEIEGARLDLHDVVAIEGPDRFDGWGIGGFLSPQNLHPSAFVVIDLHEHDLILVEGERAEIAAWVVGSRSSSLRPLTLRREPVETLAVQGSVEPFETVVTMLNTGSSGTEFARSAVTTLRGTPPAEKWLGVSGAEVLGEEIMDQTLLVGDARFHVPVLLVREQMPPPPGLVGMDVLQGTVLAFSADPHQPVLWLTPHH